MNIELEEMEYRKMVVREKKIKKMRCKFMGGRNRESKTQSGFGLAVKHGIQR